MCDTGIQSTVIIEYNEFIVIYFIFLICLYFYADFNTLGIVYSGSFY